MVADLAGTLSNRTATVLSPTATTLPITMPSGGSHLYAIHEEFINTYLHAKDLVLLPSNPFSHAADNIFQDPKGRIGELRVRQKDLTIRF